MLSDLVNTERNIVIIGRPNVGKSSLLNALLGYRRAIVWDEPGTTLDIVTEKTTWDKRTFMLTDSQGIYSEHDTKVLEELLKLGDAYIFVVDAIAGPTPFDRWIASQVLFARDSATTRGTTPDARTGALREAGATAQAALNGGYQPLRRFFPKSVVGCHGFKRCLHRG